MRPLIFYKALYVYTQFMQAKSTVTKQITYPTIVKSVYPELLHR